MIRETPWTVMRGFLMGAADIVPGVSGGTIALVVGVYERLVSSVRAGSSALGALVRADWPGTKRWLAAVEWTFLVPLVAGIGLAIVSLAGVLRDLLHDYPVQMAGLFLGLIAGSVVIAWQLVRSWDPARIGILAVATAVVFVVLGLRGGTSEEVVTQATDPTTLAFLAAGALAICAMILPGISGSFILVLLGMYSPVLAAVTDRDVVLLLVFIAGATVGLALFSQVLHWSLQHHHDSVMAALIGLMAGSSRVLWPWPDGLDSTGLEAPGEAAGVTLLLAALALAGVVAIGRLAHRFEARDDQEAPATTS